MAQLEGRAQITGTITITLTEQEAGALDALAGYGANKFLEVFYRHLGEAYLKPYEKGLRSLFDSVQQGECGIQSFLSKLRESRLVFKGTHRAVEKQEPAKE